MTPEFDPFDALRRANPRNQPGFDEGIARITGTTREALAAAALGTSGRALPRLRGAGPVRRSLQLVTGWIGIGALVLTLLVVGRGTSSAPRSSRSQIGSASSTAGSAGAGLAPGQTGGPTGASTTTTLAPNPTTTLPPVLPAQGGAPGGSQGAAAGARTTPTTKAHAPPTTVVPPTTAPPTTVAPPPTTAATSPTCAVLAVFSGVPARQSVLVQDTGSGLASISNIAIVNGTVSVPTFARGTKAAVVVVATKTDPTKSTVWSFAATDVAGHTTFCR